MVKFAELWEAIIVALKAVSAGLGIDESRILKGAPDKTAPVPPPFLYVLCLPGEPIDGNAGRSVYCFAEITVFCGMPATTEIKDSIINAVQLAGRVKTALVNTDFAEDVSAPEFVDLNSDYTCMSVDFTSLYDSYEDLIDA